MAAETPEAACVDAAKSPDRRAARLEAAAERDARETGRRAREEQLAADEREGRWAAAARRQRPVGWSVPSPQPRALLAG